ncbi:GNAT family N-acetyltransferase [Clostridium tyrobutyricum]|jgi:N-acetylglutamate synthase-like GNAT family acetyltransferase|uniref:Acetyltransferase, GNAT family n=1 Tax=Clostridium tyrobutyricum DIVETGP TaxID=1408889 RepID=W6N2L5_CLOTY|nr:GNAT family N-acetyltransferase [Clostridium tyrobutyricum]AND85971.1 acetyltransferase [Clostridium tyrobutyricum]ANP70489.1 acetyltransferase [Clostridium tyrobutyricum]MBR9647472.1 GNAT family N-acetyltransferase [Clostridium tyrobutyricum]MBV4414759.1 GNAT family N-acetyltransferase [Clostridium tyrobutyricum]MBV4432540.1 GNAT family N-acetyltransferase [Clostridium tyrobutyricum]
MQIEQDGYIFTDDIDKIKLDNVCTLLKQSHWANNRSKEIIANTIENSVCFAVYHNNIQIGFARFISDYSVYTLIMDVIIDERYRGKGLGRKLIQIIVGYPSIKNTSKVLWTTYAEKFYSQCGFKQEKQYSVLFNRPNI